MSSIQANKASARYEAKLSRVIEHIHNHLGDDLRPEDLADIACLSPYHWHRVYRSMRGESMAETIRRIRLQRAGDHLANGDLAIAAIATNAGYGSVEAFTRAFKDYSGQTPAAFREAGSHSRFKAANESIDAEGFSVTIEQRSETVAYAEPATGPYIQIDQAFERVMGRLIAGSLMTPDARLMAVFHDDPDMIEESELRAHALILPGAEVSDAGGETYTMVGGQYACLHYTGPYSDMKEAYRWFFGVWLPASGYDAADAPMIEEYLNNPAEVPASELQTLICMPIMDAVDDLGDAS